MLGGRHLRAGGRAGGRPRADAPLPFESLRDELARADIVISGTGAPGLVIHAADVEALGPRAAAGMPPALPHRHRGAARHRPRGAQARRASSSTTSTTSSRWRRPTCASAGRRRRRRRPWWTREVTRVPGWQKFARRRAPARGAAPPGRRDPPGGAREGEAAPRARSRAEQEEALDAATAAIVNKLLHPPTVAAQGSSRRTATRPSSWASSASCWDCDSEGSGDGSASGRAGARSPAGRPSTSGPRSSGRGPRGRAPQSSPPPATAADRRLESVGGKGAFLKEIEEALLAGEVDLAVHSLKDVPTVLPAGLALCAFLERADPRDALVEGGRLVSASCPRGRASAPPACGGVPSQGPAARPGRRRPPRERGHAPAPPARRPLRRDRARHGRLVRLGREAEVTERLDPEVSSPPRARARSRSSAGQDDAAIREAAAALHHGPRRAR